jgi:hypothetical protein
MVEIYVGNKNVTQYLGFLATDGFLDGNFEGNKEIKAYSKAIDFLGKKLVAAEKDKGKKAEIKERFAGYQELLKSHCGKNRSANPFTISLYEDLTEFIESPAFDKIKNNKIKEKLVALQMECFSRLKQVGQHRGTALNGSGTATSAELSKFNPTTENFKAHPKVHENAIAAAEIFNYDTCSISKDAGTAAESTHSIYGYDSGSETNPFTESVLNGNGSVNTDVRLPVYAKPAESDKTLAKNDKPQVNDDLDGVMDQNNDPLGGIF